MEWLLSRQDQAALGNEACRHPAICNTESIVHSLEARIDRASADPKFSGDALAAVTQTVMAKQFEVGRCDAGPRQQLCTQPGQPPLVEFAGQRPCAELEAAEWNAFKLADLPRAETKQADARMTRPGVHRNEHGRCEAVSSGQLDGWQPIGIGDPQAAGDERFGMMGCVRQPRIAVDQSGIKVLPAPGWVAREHEPAGRHSLLFSHE